ncbi:uncharacterized protein LOC143571155 isoform X1 [Bidens hawaiensis]|uniref:uncharacterized protein LOC143571155 isoform X1 n=1 Tax=Bidens hawaiensis TaxID=980011 RepID=UPI004049DD87
MESASTQLPGYSVPIKAPLTIDSDDDLDYLPPINSTTHTYSTTTSFNSTSSSIDISSFGDEHTSIFEAYPDEEIVIQRSRVEESLIIRPFVKYPDDNYVKESDFTSFRPFVKNPCGETSSGGFGGGSSVPIAPLSRDCDSDGDYIDGCRDSGWIPADGTVQKVTLAPKVRSFNGDEEDDNVNDELQVPGEVIGIENLNFVSTESVEIEGCKVECLNEVMKLSESDASSFEERLDAHVVSSSDSEIEHLNSVLTESVENEGECLNEVVKLSEPDASRFDLERMDAQIVSNSNSEVENLNAVATESVENEGCKVECLNEVSKLSESDASSFNLETFSSNNEIEIVTKLSESDEPSFDLERTDTHNVSQSDSGIKHLSSVTTESVENEGCKVECLNEVSESDATSFDLERTEAQTVSSSKNETEIVSKLSESDEPGIDSEIVDKQIISNSDGEQMLTKMQRVRAKFLRLALNEKLTTEVNREGGNYNFDLTVLAIGKTGVGKSATINSIFGENKAVTSAFDPSSTTIQEYTGNVDGIQLRVIDTPGLKCSSSDRSYNLKVLTYIKRFTRKHTPDVVLYVDRLDTRDVNDSDILSLITSSLGSSVWDSCIIALTHASGDLSRGFVVRRCRFIQQRIASYGGYNRHVANPVWLVDNHPIYKHDVMDLDCGITGFVCLDQVNEDDRCDEVSSFEAASEARDIINRGRERRDTYFPEYSYRVKLVGNSHWSLGCRLCI